jgi:putative phosphoesterase
MTERVVTNALKIGLISDIHGNLQALEAVLFALDPHKVDLIVCAGDLICYGANPNSIIQLCKEKHIACVTGNYDDAVAWDKPSASRKPSSPRSEQLKQAALEWTKQNITKETKGYLKSLPWRLDYQLADKHITVLHAGLDYLDEWVTPELPESIQKISKRVPADVIILGHTHQAYFHEYRRRLVINPGAVGRSLDGNTSASFAVLSLPEMKVELFCTEYDLKAALSSIEKSGMPLDIVRLLKHGARRIEEVEVDSAALAKV